MTDPSFRGQILVSTYPMIGNYGVPDRAARDAFGLPAFFESDRIWVEGIVVQDYSRYFSHWNAASSLGDWLRESGVPGIGGVDTRLLTKKIRDSGALLGKIIFDGGSPLVQAPFLDPNRRCAAAPGALSGAEAQLPLLHAKCPFPILNLEPPCSLLAETSSTRSRTRRCACSGRATPSRSSLSTAA